MIMITCRSILDILVQCEALTLLDDSYDYPRHDYDYDYDYTKICN